MRADADRWRADGENWSLAEVSRYKETLAAQFLKWFANERQAGELMNAGFERWLVGRFTSRSEKGLPLAMKGMVWFHVQRQVRTDPREVEEWRVEEARKAAGERPDEPLSAIGNLADAVGDMPAVPAVPDEGGDDDADVDRSAESGDGGGEGDGGTQGDAERDQGGRGANDPGAPGAAAQGGGGVPVPAGTDAPAVQRGAEGVGGPVPESRRRSGPRGARAREQGDGHQRGRGRRNAVRAGR